MTIFRRQLSDDRPGWEATSAGDRLAFQILVFLAATLSLAHVAYLFGIGLSAVIPVTAFVVAWLTGFAVPGIPGSGRGLSRVTAIAIFPTVFIFSLAVATFFYDVSFDGQHYHQEAVIQLAGGWNPVRDGYLSAPRVPPYINYFPKAAWVLSATLYKATGTIEAGKAINLLLIVASFYAVRSLLDSLDRLNGRTRKLISLLLALNPVVICQMFSYMVDGILYSLILILTSQLLLLLRKPSFLRFASAGCAAILLINVKYSGLVYFVSLACPYFFYVLFKHRDLTRKVFIHLVAVTLLGTLVYGYNPYVTNTVSMGNPFFRVIGEGATNTVDGHVHREFLEKSRVEKLFISLFSESMNNLQNAPELKIPFSVSPREIIPFFTPDTRIGGWGPLFGGVFLLGAVMMILLAFRAAPHVRQALLVISWLAVSIFIFPEPWWARYTPQVWILPFIAVLLSCYAGGAVLARLRNITLAVLSANVLFVAVIYTGAETWGSIYLHRQLTILSKMSEERPLPVTFQFYFPNRIRLREAGVRYDETQQPACENPVFFDRVGRERSSTATLICVDRDDYVRREASRLVVLRDWRNRFVSDVVPGGKTTDGTPLIQEARR
jgi:hypothetical protein